MLSPVLFLLHSIYTEYRLNIPCCSHLFNIKFTIFLSIIIMYRSSICIFRSFWLGLHILRELKLCCKICKHSFLVNEAFFSASMMFVSRSWWFGNLIFQRYVHSSEKNLSPVFRIFRSSFVHLSFSLPTALFSWTVIFLLEAYFFSNSNNYFLTNPL